MKKLILAAAATLAALLSAPAMADSFGLRVVDDGVSINFGIGTPPPAPFEYVPPAPPGAAWSPGYWGWTGYRYVWVPGRWVAAAPPVVVYPLATPGWAFGREHEREHRRNEYWRNDHRPYGFGGRDH